MIYDGFLLQRNYTNLLEDTIFSLIPEWSSPAEKNVTDYTDTPHI